MSTTSYTPRHPQTVSPPLSVTSPSTVGPQTQRLNIVTRLAIEGNARRAESVPIKVYMKVCCFFQCFICASDALFLHGARPPGRQHCTWERDPALQRLVSSPLTLRTTLTLSTEDNVKILESEVHPLDSSSVPYNFSSTVSPLLHNAARALNLPARSPHSYLTLFDHRATQSSRFVSSPSTSSDTDVPPLEEKYTGHILVSGYQVSFVLPSEFPPLPRSGGRLGNSGDYTPLPTRQRARRPSMSEKNVILFMAGISMMVPYLTRPQRAPWLVSLVRMFEYLG